jgi:hypothetical protein
MKSQEQRQLMLLTLFTPVSYPTIIFIAKIQSSSLKVELFICQAIAYSEPAWLWEVDAM